MPVTVKKLPNSTVEIEGELSAPLFEAYAERALKKIGENFELDGFRKGKIPESVLLSKVGDMRVLEEMASLALAEHYPKILVEEITEIEPIGRPEITLTKLARKNPLGFKIKTAVLPKIPLPDYRALSKKILTDTKDSQKPTVVSDEDVENTIMDIRKSRAPKRHMKDAVGLARNGEGDGSAEKIEELPEFNDEFIRSLGPFEDVQDFRTKLKENIKLEKENSEKEKTRLKIIEKIIEDTDIDVPELLIEIEIDKIIFRMESDITQMGLRFEDYLNELKKTKEDLRGEFKNDAVKKAKLGLILNEIAKIEKIMAEDEEIAREAAHILEHYKDADPERAKLHAENVLTNEKIFRFLENL